MDETTKKSGKWSTDEEILSTVLTLNGQDTSDEDEEDIFISNSKATSISGILYLGNDRNGRRLDWQMYFGQNASAKTSNAQAFRYPFRSYTNYILQNVSVVCKVDANIP